MASIGDAQVLSEAIGGGRDLRVPGRTAARDLPDGASTRICQGVNDPGARRVLHARRRLRAACTRTGRSSTSTWPRARSSRCRGRPPASPAGWCSTSPLDLSAGRLELRTIVAPDGGDAHLRVRITDGAGGTALLDPVGGGTLPALGRRIDTEKYWAQTLLADPAGATGVDLADITRVDLVSANDHGRVWVADLGSAPTALAAVPERRLPTVDVGTAEVVEGDGRQPVTVQLPFHVRGGLTRPARISVLTVGQTRGDIQRFTVDLAPGQTEGSIPITYTPDRRDDFAKLTTQVATWAVRNVMTDGYVGGLTVLDDDPAPRLRVRPVARTVDAGRPARWSVGVSRPTDYDQWVSARVVRGPAPALRAGAVPAAWLRKNVGTEVDPAKPLWTAKPMLFGQIRAGAKKLVLTIPTRRTVLAHPRESVTLRIQVGRKVFKRTVYVRSR